MTKIDNGTVNRIAVSVLIIIMAAGIITGAATASKVMAHSEHLQRIDGEIGKIGKIERDVAVMRAILERMEKTSGKEK